MPLAAPRSGKLTGSIAWADGQLLTGFAEVCLVAPRASTGSDWPRLALSQDSPALEVPIWTKIPISGGAFSTTVGLWYNADLVPQGTKYAIYYYDSNGVLIGSPSGTGDLFTMTAELTTPPSYTLSAPQSALNIPTPETVT